MNLNCPNCPTGGGRVIRNGHYFRQSDSRHIQNYYCKVCSKYFSSATFSDCYRQKKRRINEPLRSLLCKRMCLRDLAKHFSVSRTTIARRLVFLADQSRRRQQQFLKNYQAQEGPIEKLQFDDLITIEHTKCKPLSVTVVVEEKTRIIVGFTVAQIPAFGHLAAISRKKYGKRPDHSRAERHKLFSNLAEQVLQPQVIFRTDQHKDYPLVLKQHFPDAIHLTHKGQRGSVSGQGEMKKVRWDNLFSINQTLAMLRDKMSRLARLSWNATKKPENLAHHLAIYIDEHNRQILKKIEKKRAKKMAL